MKAAISICDFHYSKPTALYIHTQSNLGQQSICAWHFFFFFESLKSLMNGGEDTDPRLYPCFGTFVDFIQIGSAF